MSEMVLRMKNIKGDNDKMNDLVVSKSSSLISSNIIFFNGDIQVIKFIQYIST